MRLRRTAPAKSARRPEGGRPARHAIATVVFWLLPLLAFAGVLAPDLVKVQYVEAEEEIAEREGTLLFRPVRLGRPPLVVPRDYAAGFMPQVFDLERMFHSERFRGELGQMLAQLPSFPSSRGDSIVVDDVDALAAQAVFKDLLDPAFALDRRELWNPAIYDVIPPLFAIGNGNRYDDFPDLGFDPSGSDVVIPEPATGSLLGLGLLGLALHRRRR